MDKGEQRGERFAPVGGVDAGIVLLLRIPFNSPVLDLIESASFFEGRGSRVLNDPIEFVELKDPDLSLRPPGSLYVCRSVCVHVRACTCVCGGVLERMRDCACLYVYILEYVSICVCVCVCVYGAGAAR